MYKSVEGKLKKAFCFAWILTLFGICAPNAIAEVVIPFDEGSAGAAVGGFYSALGVTFAGASFTQSWALPGSGGALAVNSTTRMYMPTAARTIVGMFDTPQVWVSITGIDVGANGIRLDAYSDVSGGVLIDSDTGFGTGHGFGESYTLTGAGPGIQRIEFYQPQTVWYGEGVFFDTLKFSSAPVDTLRFSLAPSPVPEPSGIALFGTAAGLVAAGCWRRRRTANR
jgi:hypothetical protein